MDIIIRDAVARDADSIAQLASQLAQHEKQDTLCDASAIKQLLEGSKAVDVKLIVAELEAKVVGFVLVYSGYDLSSASYGFHLADLCVGAKNRRRGIGKLLMHYVMQLAIQKEYQWISLTSLKNNSEANAFYDSFGFVSVDVAFKAIGHKGMILNLSK